MEELEQRKESVTTDSADSAGAMAVNFDVNQLHFALEQVTSKLERKFVQCTSDVQKSLEEKMTSLSSYVNDRIAQMESRILNLEKHSEERSESIWRKTKHKPPVFDGTTPFEVFKIQFETAMSKNNWNNDDSAGALVLALQGSASKILQILSNDVRNNYSTLMDALQRKHGSGHMKQNYRIQLKNRVQEKGESIQQYAAEVESLAHLAYSDLSADYIEKLEVDTFIDGILDPITKRAAMLTSEASFIGVVKTAMAQEAASLICGPVETIKAIEMTNEDEMVELISVV